MHGGRNDWTALHWAAAEGRQVLCAKLLREKADPAQVPVSALVALLPVESFQIHQDTIELL